MQVIVTAGSLRAGLEAPLLVGLESFVRAPRRGEPSSAAPCPSCRGATVVSGRRGSLRWTSTCPRCGGRGEVVGVLLVRLVADEGSPDIAAILAWARGHRLRADIQMLLRDEHGPGWALTWSRPDGQPLRRWRDHLVAREALAVFVDHDDIHVALHAVREDGRIVVAGLWNVRVADDGALIRTWSERASRSLAWRRRIRFPAEAVQHALEQARTSLIVPGPALRRLRPEQRIQPPPTTSVSDAACLPPN